MCFQIFWRAMTYTTKIQYTYLNEFFYSYILSNTLKYIEMYYKCIELCWNTPPIQRASLKIHLFIIKIHYYVLIYIFITSKYRILPSKYMIVPSKNLTYCSHILQYQYYTHISFHIHLHTLRLSWNLSIPHLLVLSLTLHLKTVMVSRYTMKMSLAYHDVYVGIQKWSIFHKFPTFYWLLKYLNQKWTTRDSINTCWTYVRQ
jgi:hypothetical protein